ncbi:MULTISPECIES: DUF4267 domain-containing protein [Actinosynnema]|uniref:DUF4267 domain-containing protein n=1 Tax=Actinosynnema TaxID=40566 RepID=UPI0020A44327|nr:DUF4267 domain-containing protein [Actinosynnema pretiosum]MCP2099566.1 protein of unknown function (DUF4267) [Actinosynnema pretiosum]
MQLFAVVLTVAAALGIIVIGALYLLVPHRVASAFGLPAWPEEPGETGWLNLKGVRDVVSGLVILIPLILGHPDLTGYVLLAAALTPLGDMLTILRHKGNRTLAYGMHGGTAVVVALAGALLLAG